MELNNNLKPVNKLAAMVTKSKGDHWEKNILSHDVESIYPFPMKPLPRRVNSLIGAKSGRIKIIGYFCSKTEKINGDKKNNSHASKWVGKCDCGMYVIRRANRFRKAIKYNLNKDMCSTCLQVEKMKNKKCNSIKKIIKYQKYIDLMDRLIEYFIVSGNDIFLPFIFRIYPKQRNK